MKKKLFTTMLVTALLSSVLAGCSGKTAEKTEDKAGDSTKQEEVKQDGKVVNGTVTYDFDMTQYEQGKKIRLWIPIAKSDDIQTIKDVKYEKGSASKAELNKDELGNDMLYVEWDENAKPEDRKFSASFHASRTEVLRPELKEEGTIGSDMDEYLKPSSMVVTDGDTKKLAEEITKNETTYLGKTRAIYDWVIANMNRDESVIGCGLGNVEELLVTKKGKCTDINSVFIGLCRSVGIPARETFGVRMNDTDITKNQHCWAEFYLPGTGWVHADPADVLKAVLKNQWSKDSKETKELQEYYWGSVDAERVGLSEGRDLTLNPKQDGEPLNNFGYPYAEVDKQPIDCYSPTEFIYTISFAADK